MYTWNKSGVFQLNCSFFKGIRIKVKKALFIPDDIFHAKSCTAGITALLVHTLHHAGGIPSQHPTEMNLEMH